MPRGSTSTGMGSGLPCTDDGFGGGTRRPATSAVGGPRSSCAGTAKTGFAARILLRKPGARSPPSSAARGHELGGGGHVLPVDPSLELAARRVVDGRRRPHRVRGLREVRPRASKSLPARMECVVGGVVIHLFGDLALPAVRLGRRRRRRVHQPVPPPGVRTEYRSPRRRSRRAADVHLALCWAARPSLWQFERRARGVGGSASRSRRRRAAPAASSGRPARSMTVGSTSISSTRARVRRRPSAAATARGRGAGPHRRRVRRRLAPHAARRASRRGLGSRRSTVDAVAPRR